MFAKYINIINKKDVSKKDIFLNIYDFELSNQNIFLYCGLGGI